MLRSRNHTEHEDIKVPADQTPVSIGRAASCTVRLVDPSVSREHALIDFRAGRWVVLDRASRHGTFVNAVALPPDTPTEITRGDTIAFGPCVFIVGDGTSRERRLSTSDERADANSMLRSHPATEHTSLDRMRLALLLDAAESITRAPDEPALASVVCEVLTRGTGLPRALLLRPGADDEIDIIGSAGCSEHDTPAISRSLLRAAMNGEVVSLDRLPALAEAVSAVHLGIRSAMGVPVSIGGAVDCVLYLDARGRESSAHDDSATFASAVSRLCSLGLAGLRRAELERRQGDLIRELGAARDVQQRLLPAPSGAFGPLRYAIRSVPGRFVAGDFVTVAPLDGDRLAVVIGDVAGKGAGPGLLMASIISFIHGEFSAGRTEIARLAQNLNRYISQRAHPSEFATMWLGLVEPSERRIRFIDSGHGYALVARAGGMPVPVPSEGFLPLGVDPDQKFSDESIPFDPGDRLVLYSDGVAEQRNPEGQMFKAERAADAVRQSPNPCDDAQRLLDALTAFAAGTAFADDVTVASIELAAE